MKQTLILCPLDGDTPDNEIKMHTDNWKIIKKYLDDMKEGEDIFFYQLLLNMNIIEENYLLAVSSSLNTPTVLLQRNPNELRMKFSRQS